MMKYTVLYIERLLESTQEYTVTVLYRLLDLLLCVVWIIGEDELQDLIQKLPPKDKLKGFKMVPADFEKASQS